MGGFSYSLAILWCFMLLSASTGAAGPAVPQVLRHFYCLKSNIMLVWLHCPWGRKINYQARMSNRSGPLGPKTVKKFSLA
jgi:hypothetical protein